jgi:hypothetical protein
MNLRTYCFPVVERPVYTSDGQSEWIDPGNENTFLKGDYKAIVREDTNELISIVRRSYKVVPNETLIDQLLGEMEQIGERYEIDPSHSFVENNRMRLQVSFPEFLINDGKSDIALSLYLHNSYDLSEGVRIFWGAIRGICSNGMVFGKVLGRFYRKHTKGIQIENLKHEFSRTANLLPRVQDRIKDLDSMPVTDTVRESVQNDLGKRFSKHLFDSDYKSQWALFNTITYMISHAVAQRHRARYQMATSRIFGL